MHRKIRSLKAAVGARPGRRLFFASCALVACLVAHAGAASAANRRQQDGAASKSRIVTASGARLRDAPRAAGGEVGRLQLGTVVRELERSGGTEKVGAAEDYWYRVAAPGGAEGWVFGGLTAPFDERRRGEIYRKLAGERLKIEGASFADLTDLVGFLERAASEVKQPGERGELELLRLLALHKSLASMNFEKLAEQPFQGWVKKYEPQVVYSEPSGQWLVRAELFWDLQKKHGGLPLAERIAWEASQIELPGECEGYLPCYLYLFTVTEGRYLKLYPRGAHAGEAVGKLNESLTQIVESLASPDTPYQVPREDRISFRKTLAELRAQLSRVTHPKRASVLKHLDELGRRFR